MSAKYWDITRTAFRGCRHVSAGCDHCWAERFAWRLANNPKMAGKYDGLVTAAGWTGKTRYDRNWAAGLPTKGKKILFNCMGDLFHEANHPGDIQHCLDVMKIWSQHTFIVPTKRPMLAFYHVNTFSRHMGNMVLLASVEDQASADDRLPWVLRCKYQVKLVGASMEPLLGHINFTNEIIGQLGWVIVGKETGPQARKMWDFTSWCCYIATKCFINNVPYFDKQATKKQEIPI